MQTAMTQQNSQEPQALSCGSWLMLKFSPKFSPYNFFGALQHFTRS